MSVTFPLTSRVAITSGELRTRLRTAKISWPDACPHQLPACRLQHDALLAHPFEWLHDHRFNHAYRAIHQTLDYCRRSSATGSPAAAVRNSISCQMRRTSSATLGSRATNPPDQPNCRKGREVFKPNWLDRVFEIGIIGKGLNGAAALAQNWLLLFTAFLPALAIMILLNNVAEKIGWTGFVLARFQDRHGPLRAACSLIW